MYLLDDEEAYSFKDQYLFGSEFLVSPVVSPLNPVSNLSTVQVWLPEDHNWIEWYSGRLFQGGQVYTLNYSLSEIPVFAKAGAIVPYSPLNVKPLFGSAQNPPNRLGFFVFVDSSSKEATQKSTTNVYDDAGDTIGYLNNEFTWTQVDFVKLSDTFYRLTINPTQGKRRMDVLF
jgi:alpha-glucosidase (family GH31 glycosyl hydrolase)